MDEYLKFVQITGGFLAPITAAVVAWIAYQQFQTAKGQHQVAKDKLKLDLFDRRFKVYRGLMEFLGAVDTDAKPTQEAFGKFFAETEAAKFIFNDDISEYIKTIRSKAFDLRHANKIVAAVCDRSRDIPQEELNKASQTEGDLIKWFYEQAKVANEKFLPYLDFKKVL